MASNPEYPSKEDYNRSRKQLKEAEIAYIRSFFLYIWSNAFIELNFSDWHGVREALQHCFELSLKSMWVSLGLEYPKHHDPTKDFHTLKKRLFQVLPHMESNPLFEYFERWIKCKSKAMAQIHETTIYGDEEKGKQASEIHSKEDADRDMNDASLIYQMAFEQSLLIGKKLNILTTEDEKTLQDRKARVESIINQNLSDDLEEYIRSRFKTT